MPKIISTPSWRENASGSNAEHQFGYYEAQHFRETQEDALTWKTLEQQDLTPNGESELSPIEIGHRLWTSYRLLDEDFDNAGTTASTTIYDGKGNLITATVADAVAFAAIYDKTGNVLGVVRLNSVTHKPGEEPELTRIKQSGGYVTHEPYDVPRVNGYLAMSRAIGDASLKDSGVCSEATIDITNIREIITKRNIDPKLIGGIQVISTCDGFTDGARDDRQTKAGHEEYLLDTLKKIDAPGKKTEEELSRLLVLAAKADGSTDNISVAIQSITKKTPPFLLGVYDGHGGDAASVHTAQHIASTFQAQCTQPREAYGQQGLSVNKNQDSYKRDNPDSLNIGSPSVADQSYQTYLPLTWKEQSIVIKLRKLTEQYLHDLDEKPITAKIRPILEHLIQGLNEEKTDEARIQDFYGYLSQNDPAQQMTNIEVIKQDKSVAGKNYLAAIGVAILTVATGIVLPVILYAIVHAATGRNPLDLLNSKSEQYKKELDLVKREHHDFFGKDSDQIEPDKGEDGGGLKPT